MKIVLFRVDANKRLGIGHLSRCLTLAIVLRTFNVKSYFLIKKDNDAIEFIRNSRFELFTLPNNRSEKNELTELVKLHNYIKYKCLIMDSMRERNRKFFTAINKLCKTVVIDSEAHKSNLNADLIIWPDIKEFYPKETMTNTPNRLLVGTRYMPLRNIPKGNIRKIPNSILVSMGGTDKRQLSEKVVMSFLKSKRKFKMKIIIGKYFNDSKRIYDKIKNDPRFTVMSNVESLIPLMQECEIGIFTYGITTYESLMVGLPSLIISHSKSNHIAAQKLSRYECIHYLGYYKSINFQKIPNSVFEIISNSVKYKNFAKKGRSLVDGRGSERLAKEITRLLN